MSTLTLNLKPFKPPKLPHLYIWFKTLYPVEVWGEKISKSKKHISPRIKNISPILRDHMSLTITTSNDVIKDSNGLLALLMEVLLSTSELFKTDSS